MKTKCEEFKSLMKKHSGNKTEMVRLIERIRSYLCGAILAREFGESVESFAARNPQYSEVSAWSKTLTITNDYKLVE